MSIGPRIGARAGGRWGAGAASDDPLAAFRDPASGKAFPLTQAQWDAVWAVAGQSSRTVLHSHGMGDASGNPAAAVGTALTVTSTPTYQQPQAGFTRPAIAIAETATQRLAYAAGVGIDVSAVSGLVFGVVDITAIGAAVRDFLSLTLNAANVKASILNTNVLRITSNTVTANGTVDHLALGAFLVALQINRTAGTVALYTSAEKIAGTYSGSVVDGVKGWGTTGTPPAFRVLWDSWFSGAHAEVTEAQLRAVFSALGWPPPW